MRDNENLLARQAWGIFPESPRRRRAAYVAACSRAVLFIIVLVCSVAIYLGIRIHGGKPLDDVACFELFGIGWWLGVVFCAAAPFQLENALSNGHVLRSNYHDYYLAGCSGEDMLKGIAAPQLRGIKLFGIVYPACMLLFLLVLLPFIDESESFFWSFLILIPSLFNLFQVSCFSLALWPWKIGREVRAMILAFMIFTSPFTVCALLMPVLIFMGARGYSWVAGFVPVELFTLLVRFMVIDVIWDQALDRLEMRFESWRDPVNPFPEPGWKDAPGS